MDTKDASNEALGAILGGMIAFDQSISNRLMADGWGAAEEWATRYAKLFEAIDRVNNDLNVARILDGSYWPGDAESSANHYREMRGKFEGVV